MNIQNTEVSYSILKYDGYNYYNFLLENDTYEASIPYAGGTGAFQNGNGTDFNLDYNGETGYYDITLTDVGNGKWGVSILPTPAQMDVVPDQTYTGSAITPEPTVVAGSLSLTKGTDYTYSYTDNTNVGTATVRATFQGDYESLGYVERTFTIGKATPTVTAPTAIDDLIYSGSAQALVTAGSTDFGTLIYSTDGENYSADIPTATEAGTYTVYYKVVGSDNWNAVDAQTVSVTIAPRTYTVTYVDENGAEQEVTATPLDGTETAIGTDNEDTWYAANSDIIFDHTLTLNGDVHLILADGCTMNVGTSSSPVSGIGIDSRGWLYIYGQSSGTGALNAYSSGDNNDAIVAADIEINGGNINVTSTDAYGIHTSNTITLGWTRATDRITASSYSGTIKVADGKALTDGGGSILSGTLAAADVNGKTLAPCLVLDETSGVTPLTALAGQTNLTVAFIREFTEGVSSTVCLPFGFTPSATEQGTFHRLESVNDERTIVNMSTAVSETDANVPYIFIPAKTGNITFVGIIDEVPATCEPTADTRGDWTFEGTYSLLQWSDATLLGEYTAVYGYVAQSYETNGNLQPGQFRKVRIGGTSTTKPFRACMKYKEPAGSRSVSRAAASNIPETLTVVVKSANGNTTAIDSHTGALSIESGSWYDMSGRRLSGKPTVKGVYINSGRKIIIK
ncbi:MAG: hypothetical protein IJ580_05100 [Prevotella sp.]|nr:hypothetical protein [Prevotella sp.]